MGSRSTSPIKTCRACGLEKPLYEFYRHPTGADGHRNHCIECCGADRRKRYMDNREAVLEYQRKLPQTEERKLRKTVYLARWRRSHPQQYREELDRGNARRRAKRAADPAAYAEELKRNKEWKRQKRAARTQSRPQ